MRHIHALTPGDHFSPRTGSAVATVVDGLARHSQERSGVLVARGTYADRYPSADPIEYDLHVSPHGASRRVRAVDVAAGRMGLPRPWARRIHRQMVLNQEAWEPSLLLAHNGPQLLPLLSRKHLGVLYAHNNLLDWYGAREATHILERAYRVVAVSAYTASRIAEKVPTVSDRLRVVHNAVEIDAFDPQDRSTAEHLRVGFVGRVIPSKGVDVLMRAVVKLGRPDVDLTVVGSPGFTAEGLLSPYEAHLRRLAETVAGGVSFRPFTPRGQLAAVYSEFDVVVVPSVEPEAFPLTILEGMASGAAVVASDIGGTAEAVDDGGVLVSPGDVNQLSEVLESLAIDRALVSDLSNRGRARAERRTWDHSAEDLRIALS